MKFPLTCNACRLEAGGGYGEPVKEAQRDLPAVGSIAGIRTLLAFATVSWPSIRRGWRPDARCHD